MRGRTLDRREKAKRTFRQKQIDALAAVYYGELSYVFRSTNNTYYPWVYMSVDSSYPPIDVTARMDKLRRIGMVRWAEYKPRSFSEYYTRSNGVPKTYMLTSRGNEEVRKLGL